MNKKLPYLIAEIGGNHEGNFESAKNICNLAIKSNVDCIKFQLYSANNLVNINLSPDRYQHFKKFELTKSQYIYLAELCIDSGIDYLSSIWDISMLDWVDKYMKYYKIGSGDLTARPLIKEFAQRGKPIILSTGLSTHDEILSVIDYIRNINHFYSQQGAITLLQCTSMYPISNSDANVGVLNSFRTIDNVNVGYSDHTEGLDALIVAAIMGSSMLEFHFTDNKNNSNFRDHKVSLELNDVLRLKNSISNFFNIIGSSVKTPLPIEISNGHVHSFRRGLFPSRDLKAGTIISPQDILCLRPNNGISAVDYDKLIGSLLLVDVKYLDCLNWNMFSRIS